MPPAASSSVVSSGPPVSELDASPPTPPLVEDHVNGNTVDSPTVSSDTLTPDTDYSKPDHVAGEPAEPSTSSSPRVGSSLTTTNGFTVTVHGSAILPTHHGAFRIVSFKNTKDRKDHVALVKGVVAGRSRVPTRLHSECLTGDVFSSLRCDCREQLHASLETLGARETGIVLYMRQEGRGIGLADKVRAYGVQDSLGLDTVDANLHLGLEDDSREYEVAAAMLQLLGVASIQLLTNNPRKLEGLATHDIVISERLPLEIVPNEHNLHYLQTKFLKSNHMLTSFADDDASDAGAGGAELSLASPASQLRH